MSPKVVENEWMLACGQSMFAVVGFEVSDLLCEVFKIRDWRISVLEDWRLKGRGLKAGSSWWGDFEFEVFERIKV